MPSTPILASLHVASHLTKPKLETDLLGGESWPWQRHIVCEGRGRAKRLSTVAALPTACTTGRFLSTLRCVSILALSACARHAAVRARTLVKQRERCLSYIPRYCYFYIRRICSAVFMPFYTLSRCRFSMNVPGTTAGDMYT